MEAVVDKSAQTHRVGKFEFSIVVGEGELSPHEVAEHRARRTEALARWLLAQWQREHQDFRNN